MVTEIQTQRTGSDLRLRHYWNNAKVDANIDIDVDAKYEQTSRKPGKLNTGFKNPYLILAQSKT